MFREWGALLPALLGMFYLVGLRALLQAQPEIGDGALHYVQVLHAWQHPVLFLDVWAKPLYVILGAPFALMGTWGLTLFNGVVFLATSACIMASIPRSAWPLRWLAPVLVAISPQYLFMVYAGMTEPLFGLLCVAAVMALFAGHVRTGLLIASLMPVARPEYIVVLPVVMAWALWRGKGRSLPWAFVGIVVFSLLGAVAHHDLFWLVREDPYIGNTTYGSGDWAHFLEQAPQILGYPLLFALLVATVWGVLLWWKMPEKRRELLDLFALALLPVVLIWCAHSYAWWKGDAGSAGLLRVFATTVPLSVLFVLQVVRHGTESLMQMRIVWLGLPLLAVLAFPLGWMEARTHVPIPAVMVPEQNQVERAAQYVLEVRKPNARIAYLHPHFGVVTGLDTWDSTQAMNITSLPWQRPGADLRPNDLVVWDSHFGPNETALPLQHILSDSALTLLRVFEEGAGWQGTAEPFSVWVFERIPSSVRWETDTLLRMDLGDPESWHQRPPAQGISGHLSCSVRMDGDRELRPPISLPPEQPNIPILELTASGDAMPGGEDGNWQLVLTVTDAGREVHIQRKDMQTGAFSASFTLPAEFVRMDVRLKIEQAEKTLAGIKGYTVVLRQLHTGSSRQ